MAGEEKVEKSNILMYTTEDGVTKVEVTFDNDTVWLSLDQIADLFQSNKSTISRHKKYFFRRRVKPKFSCCKFCNNWFRRKKISCGFL